jgi:hypothetical protein
LSMQERGVQRSRSHPLSAYFSGPTRRRGSAIGRAGDTSAVRLAPSPQTVSPRCPYRGPPAPASVHRPDRLPLVVMPALVLEERRRRQSPPARKAHHRRLARLQPTQHRGEKKPGRLLAGLCRATSKGGKLARSAPRAGPSNFSRCASEPFGLC